MDLVIVTKVFGPILTFFWRIFTWHKRRGKIEIKINIMENANPNGLECSRSKCKCWLINTGEQSISVNDVWVEETDYTKTDNEKTKRREWKELNLPINLLGGQSSDPWIFTFPKEHNICCCAKDANEKTYYSKVYKSRFSKTFEQ